MKKRAAVLLLSFLTLVAGIFSGCSSAGKAGSRTYSIPKSGVVTEASLEQLKAKGGLAIYQGSADGIDYEWTFVGRDIPKPADANLKISFKPADAAAMKAQAGGGTIFAFSSAQKGALPGEPSLSITVGGSWAYGTYNLYSYRAGAAAAAGSVQVVDGVATLKPAEGGEYFFTKSMVDSAVSSPSSAVTASGPATDFAASAASAASSASSQKGGGGADAPKANAPPTSSSAAPGAGSSPTSSGTAQPGVTQPGTAPSSPSARAPVSQPKKDPNKTITITLTIRCDTAVANWANLKPNKQDHSVVPANGVILPVTSVTLNEGETVYDLLVKVCEENRIQMEHRGYAIYNSEYIAGINNLYEFDGGELSGWMYEVNGWYPNYGVSLYELENGDAVAFNYTCDLGHDLPGAGTAAG